MIEALYNAVIVKPVEVEETMYGNIVVPDLGNETNKTGQVVAVGPGHTVMGGNFIPTQLQVDEIVVLPTLGFTKFEYDGEEYWIGKENEVLAKIIKTEKTTNE
jgi:co-chaperonin GroES (HSP10)|uniref:Co-chaperonin GroES n=1 Tax=uncultured virus TaxID=340016 RepID=A0A221S442_9VIRU|nr:co-chaperonin GroES [uncultured virus]